MDLTTKYLGLSLKTPLVVSASPLTSEVQNVKKLEDVGASAVVLYSLFEEQLKKEQEELDHHLTAGTESFAEALSYFPEADQYLVGPEKYLGHISKCKEAVDIPVIASLNGSSIGGWTSFAKQIENAGADALELNIYYIPTDANLSGADVEKAYIDIVKAVKSEINIPIAVKLSPYFSNMTNMGKQFDEAGANGLVLFNRFYQPDFDLDELEVVPNLLLSTPQAMRVPLTWIAILYGNIQADLAATGGIHYAEDVLKVLMAGSKIAMMASGLLRNGIEHLKVVETNMVRWMEEHEYESVKQMQGSMSQQNVADPSAFERAQYIRAIKSFPEI
jgi:dihydroorotate dehydrogenase (fumarate)